MQLQDGIGLCKVGQILSNSVSGASEPLTKSIIVHMQMLSSETTASTENLATTTKFLLVVKDKASILSLNPSHALWNQCPLEKPYECLNIKENLVDGTISGRKNPALITLPG